MLCLLSFLYWRYFSSRNVISVRLVLIVIRCLLRIPGGNAASSWDSLAASFLITRTWPIDARRPNRARFLVPLLQNAAEKKRQIKTQGKSGFPVVVFLVLPRAAARRARRRFCRSYRVAAGKPHRQSGNLGNFPLPRKGRRREMPPCRVLRVLQCPTLEDCGVELNLARREACTLHFPDRYSGWILISVE